MDGCADVEVEVLKEAWRAIYERGLARVSELPRSLFFPLLQTLPHLHILAILLDVIHMKSLIVLPKVLPKYFWYHFLQNSNATK